MLTAQKLFNQQLKSDLNTKNRTSPTSWENSTGKHFGEIGGGEGS